jgi:hypothetical protein
LEGVVESAYFAAQRSVDVGIRRAAVDALALTLSAQDPPCWSAWCHFFDGGEKTIAYFLALDCINFCFWALPGEERWHIETGEGELSGYYGLALRLKQAIEEGHPLTDPFFLREISETGLRRILGGSGQLQLLSERAAILRETGRVLIEHFHGKASELIAASERSAKRLVELIAELFPSFRDVAFLEGERIPFLKRAQLFATDIYGAFGGSHWGDFHDMDLLSAFADYKLPQVLRHFGVLTYGEALAAKVDSIQLLPSGCREEIEIRANTIVAVEMLKESLFRLGKNLKSYQIDWLLWNLGQRDDVRARPYHRTVSIYY